MRQPISSDWERLRFVCSAVTCDVARKTSASIQSLPWATAQIRCYGAERACIKNPNIRSYLIEPLFIFIRIYKHEAILLIINLRFKKKKQQQRMPFTTGYTGNQFKLKPDVLFCFFNNLVIGRIIFPRQSKPAVEKTKMFYGRAKALQNTVKHFSCQMRTISHYIIQSNTHNTPYDASSSTASLTKLLELILKEVIYLKNMLFYPALSVSFYLT